MITDSINKALRIWNNDYFAIKSLVINRFTISGALAHVKLEEILGFPNLENLTLCNLCLNSDDISYIMGCQNLENLRLINCEISENVGPINIKNITLDNTNIRLDENYVYKTLTIKNMAIPFKKIKAATLIINQALETNLNVTNYEIGVLVVSKEQYLKNKDYLDKLSNIKIELREKIQVGD